MQGAYRQGEDRLRGSGLSKQQPLHLVDEPVQVGRDLPLVGGQPLVQLLPLSSQLALKLPDAPR
jgi:hypothetical protein